MASLEELLKLAEGQNWILVVPVPLEFPKIRINIHTNMKDPGGIVSGILFHAAKISLSNEAKNVRPEGVPVQHGLESEDRSVEAPKDQDQAIRGETGLPKEPGA